jgi:hypothetical protein
MSAARLKHFGWGREGEDFTAEEEAFVAARAQACFGTALSRKACSIRAFSSTHDVRAGLT